MVYICKCSVKNSQNTVPALPAVPFPDEGVHNVPRQVQ